MLCPSCNSEMEERFHNIDTESSNEVRAIAFADNLPKFVAVVLLTCSNMACRHREVRKVEGIPFRATPEAVR